VIHVNSRALGPGQTTSSELGQAVQWLFLAALIQPDAPMWVQAPVLDDAPLLDNTTGAFDALEPGWGHRLLHLKDVVLRLAGTGQPVFLATTNSSIESTLDDLRAAVSDHGLADLVHFQRRDWLATPGILTRHGWLSGHFELRSEGVVTFDSLARLEFDPARLAAGLQLYERDWNEWRRSQGCLEAKP
jgi:hypothetical protein